MPTIHRERGYRLSFYSKEEGEPPHVHVFHGDGEAKVWLESVALASSRGFSLKQIRDSIAIVRATRDYLLEQWHGYFAEDR
jgi:hypothetical protein